MEMKERIRTRRSDLKLTQTVLAKLVGVNRVTVTGWESGDYKPGGENLQALAAALECNAQWLLDGKGDPGENAPPATSPSDLHGVKEIPVISWVQAGGWTESDPSVSTRDAKEWIFTTAQVSSDGFALRVRGDSMTNPTGAPSIPEGSLVVVEPNSSPDEANGKIVVAQIMGSSEATLKKFVIDGPQRYLIPLNPNYRPLEVNGNCRLVGIVKQVIMDL